ncbi:hypothetical protein TARUN_4959 [Trichoderma arundinaceum]|uniref:Myb-like domain-containing protein n=1 Tax=Trichoderma arundinaceum TaxID=490622 RepID=A0A395NN20_TRIAR|nr:hypothetical protein TARUN_4959 [Trichoderma arundinaceum]
MTFDHDNEDLLYNLAYECEELFDQLQQALHKTKSEITTIELCAEFQQRFAIWAAHLGVFARKSQCLDTRLQNLPDLQDLVARLLDILRRSLQQCKVDARGQGEGDLDTRDCSEFPPKAAQILTTTLRTIDDTLTRLNRLGVTIRQSGRGKVDVRAKKFAAGLDLDSFAYLCANAVQALYPGAHQSLKDHLSKSMTDRYARTLFLNSRHQKLQTRREPSTGLSTIQEVPSNETQTNIPIAQPVIAIKNPAVPKFPRAPIALSQSDLSSVNIQQIRSRLRPPDEASTKFHKTSSIQVNQGNYPQPPTPKEGSNIFTCQWCSELFSKKSLSESEWRNPQTLYSHLEESHNSDFSNTELQAISRQSKTEQPRAWNDCLLCCFTVEEQGNKDEALFPKRRKGQQKQETSKSARTTLEMTNPKSHHSDTEFSDMSSDSDDMDSHQQRRQQRKDRSKAVARHIAVHLQVLMLLTLRFADLQNDDGNLDDDDFKSDSVDIDEGNSASEGTDLGRLSHITSEADVTMKDAKDMDDADDEEDAMDLDDGIVDNDIPVPDTDLDLEFVPRQYDDLEVNNDDFLNKVIESGAYQSWRKKEEEEMLERAEKERLIKKMSTQLERLQEEEKRMREEPVPDYIAQLNFSKEHNKKRLMLAKTMVKEEEGEEEGERKRAEQRAEKRDDLERIEERGRQRGERRPKHQEEDDDYEVTIVTPPEWDKERHWSPYDPPNADVMIDNEIYPRELERFKAAPGDTEAPMFKSRDPSCERERPLLNLVHPTPVPSPVPALGASYTKAPLRPLPRAVAGTREDGSDYSKSPVEDDSDVSSLDEELAIRPKPAHSRKPSHSRNPVSWGENMTKNYEVAPPEVSDFLPETYQVDDTTRPFVVDAYELIRRRPQPVRSTQRASSYWTTSEAEMFPGLLSEFGTDWSAIAEHMGTKTYTMVKNYYNRKKDSENPEWEAIVQEADAKRARGETLEDPPVIRTKHRKSTKIKRSSVIMEHDGEDEIRFTPDAPIATWYAESTKSFEVETPEAGDGDEITNGSTFGEGNSGSRFIAKEGPPIHPAFKMTVTEPN